MNADIQSEFSDRLRQAIAVGMVQIRTSGERASARILAPPDADKLSDTDWLNVMQAATEIERELRALGVSTAPEKGHPGEFSTFCDRCKKYREDCLVVPYVPPPMLTPPELEPVIGPDYIDYRVVFDPEDLRMRHAAMCAECRAAKILFSASQK